ncbi:hypothetical protein MIND_01392500 [Mycena indigotica]|uniref:DUF6534 domain-containing protein n=1 Tax=Mycena indigotica TaxID=2126181 RepID=A0A8H6VPH3_9AGAR|nr:uncharacterized protein MIND_01392500 [Mycena indigotica]KAF7289307.1 hypothetical protein MIND_01392500 [Mycena indigotica]
MDLVTLPPQSVINNTLGALQIGTLLSYLLFGITTTQVYIYYTRFPEDAPWIRLMVAFVWILEATQTGLVGYVVYFYTITDYGDKKHALQSALPPLLVSFILTGAITTLVELFFIYRIHQLSKRVYVPAILAVLPFIYFMGTTAFTIASFKLGTWAHAEEEWGWDILASAILSVVTDLSISAALVILLAGNRRRGTATTSAIIDQVITWTIETGVATSLCSVLILIFYETMQKSFIWLAVFIIKSRLFSNSLLASLNSRAALREIPNITLPASAPQFSHAGSRMEDHEMFHVQVETKTHVHRDRLEDSGVRKLWDSEELV